MHHRYIRLGLCPLLDASTQVQAVLLYKRPFVFDYALNFKSLGLEAHCVGYKNVDFAIQILIGAICIASSVGLTMFLTFQLSAILIRAICIASSVTRFLTFQLYAVARSLLSPNAVNLYVEIQDL